MSNIYIYIIKTKSSTEGFFSWEKYTKHDSEDKPFQLYGSSFVSD